MAKKSNEGQPNIDYRAAYLRQKKARAEAEELLETRSSELYDANQSLRQAYDKLKDQKSHLFQQEKLASIGQLSAGVAHEINNPAGYVKCNLGSLKRYMETIVQTLDDFRQLSDAHPQLKEDILSISQNRDIDFIVQDTNELLSESISGLSRIEEIVLCLKNFARQDAVEFVEFDINKAIENTVKLVQKEILYKGRLTTQLQAQQKLLGQPGNISQVILNLLVNASQAIDNGGEIILRTYDTHQRVVIQVQDDGCGIEEKDIKNIFDPFFTTKEIGIGTGLGLSVSHGIIEKHHGQFFVSSQIGQGSTFTIILPAAEAPAESSTPY